MRVCKCVNDKESGKAEEHVDCKSDNLTVQKIERESSSERACEYVRVEKAFQNVHSKQIAKRFSTLQNI